MEIREGVSPSRMPIFMYFSEFFRVKKGERGFQERQGRGDFRRCRGEGAAEPAAMQRLTQPETEPILVFCRYVLKFFAKLHKNRHIGNFLSLGGGRGDGGRDGGRPRGDG